MKKLIACAMVLVVLLAIALQPSQAVADAEETPSAAFMVPGTLLPINSTFACSVCREPWYQRRQRAWRMACPTLGTRTMGTKGIICSTCTNG